jgi:hypothetical protein
MVNLIDQKGQDEVLAVGFRDIVDIADRDDIRLISFDFHKECRDMQVTIVVCWNGVLSDSMSQYQNVWKLVDIVQDEISAMGERKCSSSPGHCIDSNRRLLSH